MKTAAQSSITDVSVRACPLFECYSKSRWSFDDLQNKVFVVDRKEAVSPFAKNHFFFCLLFGFEPGLCVPDPLEGEIVPPPLVLAFYKIDTHRGPPSWGRTENPRASCRPIPANFYTPSWCFCADIGRSPRGSEYRV